MCDECGPEDDFVPYDNSLDWNMSDWSYGNADLERWQAYISRGSTIKYPSKKGDFEPDDILDTMLYIQEL